MVGVAIGAAIAGVGAYAGGKAMSRATRDAANRAQIQAWQQQVADENAAKQQREQVAALQRDQQQFEVGRQDAQNAFNTQRQAEADRAAKELQAQMERQASQAASDLATGSQNQRVSELTPNVELGANNPTAAGDDTQKKRRAQFQPSYTSGVTI